MIPEPKVSLIILNWNNYHDTKECLQSLEKITYSNYQIIVVDNGSQDGSTKRLQEEFLQHIYIYNKDNLGFAGGNNVGVRYALENKSDYILLLNNDTVVREDFLEILVSTAESDKRTGICGPKICHYEDPSKIWFTGGKINWLRATNFDRKDKDTIKSPLLVEMLSGCCLLIKKEVFNKIGFLDESYFLYFEDIDFCIRAKRAGYSIIWGPRSVIYHKIAANSQRISPESFYHFYRSKMMFMKRWAPLPYKILFFAIFPIYLIAKMAIFKFSGKSEYARALKNVLLDFNK